MEYEVPPIEMVAVPDSTVFLRATRAVFRSVSALVSPGSSWNSTTILPVNKATTMSSCMSEKQFMLGLPRVCVNPVNCKTHYDWSNTMVQREHNLFNLKNVTSTHNSKKTFKNRSKIGAPTEIALIRSGHQNRSKISLV